MPSPVRRPPDEVLRLGLDRRGEHAPHALPTGQGPWELGEHEADEAQRPDEQGEQVDDGGDVAHGHGSGLDAVRAGHHQDDVGERRHGVEQGLEGGAQPGHLDLGVAQGRDLGLQPGRFVLLGAQRLHHEGTVEALVHERRHVADPVLGLVGRPGHPPLVVHVQQAEGGEQDEGDGAEDRIDQEQPDRGHDHHDHHARRVGQRRQHLGGRFGVDAGVGHELARGVLLEPRQRLGLVPVDDVGPQGGQDAPLGDAGERAAHDHADGAHQADADDGQAADDHVAGAHRALLEAGHDHLVGHPAHRPGRGHRGQCEHRGAGHRQEERPGVEVHLGADHPRPAPEHGRARRSGSRGRGIHVTLCTNLHEPAT